MSRSRVDLPQPDGPIRLRTPARRCRRSISLSATVVVVRHREASCRRRRTDDRTAIRIGHPANLLANAQSSSSSTRRTIAKKTIPRRGRGDDRWTTASRAQSMYCWLKKRIARPRPYADAARPLADDRADDACGGRDLEGGEQVGQRCRQAQLPQHRRGARRVGTHQLERARIGRAQSAHHRDGDRKEAEVRGDEHHARHVLADQEHDHRRERHDRHRLAGDDIRRQRRSTRLE